MPAGKTKSNKSGVIKTSVVLQYGEKSVPYDDLTARVREILTKEHGRKLIDIDDVQLYIKPEENKVYYVVDGEPFGDFDL